MFDMFTHIIAQVVLFCRIFANFQQLFITIMLCFIFHLLLVFSYSVSLLFDGSLSYPRFAGNNLFLKLHIFPLKNFEIFSIL